MIKGFKDFVTRGNAIEMAIGIVLGLAFKAVIDAIIAGFISPLVAAIFGQPNLTSIGNFTIGQGEFSIGIILQALFSFVSVALALYFVIVVPLNKLAERRTRDQLAEDTGPTEIELLTEIRDALQSQSK
jgi:large conductance mechanosensitive channel